MRFSRGEMARRFRLARDLMDELELQALVLFGNSGVNRHNNVNPFWLSQYLDMHHCYVVVPRAEDLESALYVGLANHVPSAREVTDLPVVEWGGYDAGQTLVGRLRELGVTRGRVGLVGVNHTWSIGMPWQHYARLREALPQLEPVDVTAAYAQLRAVKSEEEVERLRAAAALTDLAILAAQREARPGIAETELVAAIEDAYRRRGGHVRITFLRSMPMRRPTGCVPSQNPSGRRLRRGDVVITELSASFDGYSGQIHRPVFVQAEPTDAWLRLFDVAARAYERIVDGLRSGSTEGDVIRNAAIIGDAGYEIFDDLIHGYGTDIHPPLVDRSCVAYWRTGSEPPDGRTIEQGMAIVVQPNPITPDERMGLQVGALTVVREGGAECLHEVPLEPLIAR
ncbi:MAG TPA: Xaa-Pro peptidase family protein [Gaiellaceae bacterium]|nr:Xaa-Pro peptidase family protein [Gaiellaceae bacterium]